MGAAPPERPRRADEPATFEMTPVGQGRHRRALGPVVVVGAGLAAVVAIGTLGGPGPTPRIAELPTAGASPYVPPIVGPPRQQPAPSPTAPTAPAASLPAITADLRASAPSPAPGKQLVLAAPATDGAAVHGDVQVIGYVAGGPTAVRVVLDAAGEAVGSQTVAARPLADDPAGSGRAWFRASIPLDPFVVAPIALEVTLLNGRGDAREVLRRALTLTPSFPGAAGSQRGTIPAGAGSPNVPPAPTGGRSTGRVQGTDGLLGGIVFRRVTGEAVDAQAGDLSP